MEVRDFPGLVFQVTDLKDLKDFDFRSGTKIQTYKKTRHLMKSIGFVPQAGLEPALAFKYELDFKSNVSTNSTTAACLAGRQIYDLIFHYFN